MLGKGASHGTQEVYSGVQGFGGQVGHGARLHRGPGGQESGRRSELSADWQKKFAAEPGSPVKGEAALQLEVRRLRELSPLYEMAKEGIDLKSVAWQRG